MLLSILYAFFLLEVLWTVFGFYMAMRAAWLARTLTKTAIALWAARLLNSVSIGGPHIAIPGADAQAQRMAAL